MRATIEDLTRKVQQQAAASDRDVPMLVAVSAADIRKVEEFKKLVLAVAEMAKPFGADWKRSAAVREAAAKEIAVVSGYWKENQNTIGTLLDTHIGPGKVMPSWSVFTFDNAVTRFLHEYQPRTHVLDALDRLLKVLRPEPPALNELPRVHTELPAVVGEQIDMDPPLDTQAYADLLGLSVDTAKRNCRLAEDGKRPGLTCKKTPEGWSIDARCPEIAMLRSKRQGTAATDRETKKRIEKAHADKAAQRQPKTSDGAIALANRLKAAARPGTPKSREKT